MDLIAFEWSRRSMEYKTMNSELKTKMHINPAKSFTPVKTGFLQKKCASFDRPGLVKERLEQDQEKLTLYRSPIFQAEPEIVPPICSGAQDFRKTRAGYDLTHVPINSAAPLMIRKRLTISQPGDQYEREADTMTEKVMHTPNPLNMDQTLRQASILGSANIHRQPVNRSVGGGSLRSREFVSGIPEAAPRFSAHINDLSYRGQPLSESVRAFFEPRFGNDFSHVRIHTNHQATQMAHALNARAFTIGSDVVFGSRQYSPETSEGLGLIAHELAHVTQRVPGIQRSGYGPCTEILETLINDVERSNWPMWLKITYFIVSPLWIGAAAALQFLCMELWHYIIGPISEAWSQEEELPLTEENFLLRLQEETSSRSSP